MPEPCPVCGGSPVRGHGSTVAYCPACLGLEDAPPDTIPIGPVLARPAGTPPPSERSGLVAQLVGRVTQLRRQYQHAERTVGEQSELLRDLTAWARGVIASAQDVARENTALRSQLDQAEAQRDEARRTAERLRAELQLLRRRLGEGGR